MGSAVRCAGDLAVELGQHARGLGGHDRRALDGTLGLDRSCLLPGNALGLSLLPGNALGLGLLRRHALGVRPLGRKTLGRGLLPGSVLGLGPFRCPSLGLGPFRLRPLCAEPVGLGALAGEAVGLRLLRGHPLGFLPGDPLGLGLHVRLGPLAGAAVGLSLQLSLCQLASAALGLGLQLGFCLAARGLELRLALLAPLIVVADLAPGQTVTAATPPPAPAPGEKEQALPGDGLGGDAGLASDRSKVSTIAWGVFTAAIGLGWWLTIRRRRHWLSYAGGVLPFFVSLFFFYAHLELLLPANF